MVVAIRLPVTLPIKLPVVVPIVAATAWIACHFKELDPKSYVESIAGSISLDKVVSAKRLPVRFPITLPVVVPIVAASAKILCHLREADPKSYVESISGSISLDKVVDAKRLPVRFPITLPVTVSIAAASP